MNTLRTLAALCLLAAFAATGCSHRTLLHVEEANTQRTIAWEPILIPAEPPREAERQAPLLPRGPRTTIEITRERRLISREPIP